MELADIHLKSNIVREFAGIPLPAAIVIRTVVSTRIDDRSRIDRRLNDRRRLSDDHRLSDHRISDPSEVVHLNQHVMVRVEGVEVDRKRISLALT